VPKFHLPAHIESCNLQFSFNLTRWVGQHTGDGAGVATGHARRSLQ
jgi:hypothetical protein